MSRWIIALLWSAPELMASQRAGVAGLSTGTQKGDVYSFAIILHEILYRAGLFRCVDEDEPIPAKSKSLSRPSKTDWTFSDISRFRVGPPSQSAALFQLPLPPLLSLPGPLIPSSPLLHPRPFLLLTQKHRLKPARALGAWENAVSSPPGSRAESRPHVAALYAHKMHLVAALISVFAPKF